VRTTDGDVFVRDTGPIGPRNQSMPVVLVHGWMASSDLNWFTVFEALGRERRTIALDLRHHGRGMASSAPFEFDRAADDVAEVLDGLGIDRALVVGYSLGTAVAQTFALRHGDRCGGIVLCAGALHWRGPMRRFFLWRGGWDGTVQRLSLGRWAGQRMADHLIGEQPHLAPYREWLIAELERGHPGGLRSAGRALARFDSRKFDLQGCPVVTVVMKRDRLVPTRRQRKLGRHLDAEVIELDGGHLAAAYAGEELSRTLVGALRRLAPAETPAAA
jgi:3-oxoadipate enol-lactonase